MRALDKRAHTPCIRQVPGVVQVFCRLNGAIGTPPCSHKQAKWYLRSRRLEKMLHHGVADFRASRRPSGRPSGSLPEAFRDPSGTRVLHGISAPQEPGPRREVGGLGFVVASFPGAFQEPSGMRMCCLHCCCWLVLLSCCFRPTFRDPSKPFRDLPGNNANKTKTLATRYYVTTPRGRLEIRQLFNGMAVKRVSDVSASRAVASFGTS